MNKEELTIKIAEFAKKRGYRFEVSIANEDLFFKKDDYFFTYTIVYSFYDNYTIYLINKNKFVDPFFYNNDMKKAFKLLNSDLRYLKRHCKYSKLNKL